MIIETINKCISDVSENIFITLLAAMPVLYNEVKFGVYQV